MNINTKNKKIKIIIQEKEKKKNSISSQHIKNSPDYKLLDNNESMKAGKENKDTRSCSHESRRKSVIPVTHKTQPPSADHALFEFFLKNK